MKIPAAALAAAATLGLATGAGAQEAKPVAPPPSTPTLKDPQAQASYAIGLNLGQTLKRDAVTVDPAIVAEGLRDALSGGPTALTDDQVRAALGRLQTEVQARRQNLAAHAAETNAAEGEAFLKANAAKPGVVVLPSGLQYQVITAGAGPTPRMSDTVVCNYRGTLINGTEFDSSYRRGEPSSFQVSGVIKGWTEALQRMPVGSKWRLFVPANLAYGARGAGAEIGPNATLVFEVELLSIQ